METFSAKKVFEDIRNFLAGRFMGATRDEFLLEEVVKLIFCKYKMTDISTDEIDDISLSGLYRKIFKSVLSQYPDIYENENSEIELDPISIKYVDSRINTINITSMKRDIIGDAYEIFIGDAIKGQSGQFFTPQNAAKALVEMIEPNKSDKVLDLTCGAGGFLVATVKYWNSFPQNAENSFLYGIDKDSYLTRLAKIHLACLGQNTLNIKCADSLVWDKKILGNDTETYDVILTNPPFGVNIQTGSHETLEKFDLAYKYKKSKDDKWKKTDLINETVPPQVVFMEQCVKLIKKKGIIGIVVPESMISNKKYSYVVDFLFQSCYIKAVIGMPDDLFKTSGKGGTHTKTCLMILEKKDTTTDCNYNIFMAEAKWCGHDSRGREIPKDDIPTIVENYLNFQKDGMIEKSSELGFVLQKASITNNVLAPRAYVHMVQDNIHSFDDTHLLISIGELIEEGVLQIATGNEVGKLAYGTGNIPFVRTSDISNWEIKSDPKHLLSEDIYNSLAEKQDVKEGDILMVKDGSYLIGTCAMITKFDQKIVYQSHLYKIRVLNNKYNLNEYYLLALLSSDYLRKQISANTFSHDIINSLGDRLKDLVLPISRDVNKINNIANMVKESIEESIHARELSKKARIEVLL